MAVAVLVTLLAGAATVVGGVLATLGRLRDERGVAVSLGFAAGAMVTVSLLEIVPNGVVSLGEATGTGRAVLLTLGLVILGAVAVHLVQRLVPQATGVPDAAVDTGVGPALRERDRLRRSGVVVALVVAGHNLPEGLATFVAALDDPTTGIVIAVAIAIHNVPEGVAVAAPIHAATGSRRRAVAYAAGSGLAEPVGGVLGYLLLAAVLPDEALGAVFGLIAGMMLQISAAELLPAALRLAGRRAGVVGALVGAAVMVVSLVLLRIA